jgi:hypothetical protein
MMSYVISNMRPDRDVGFEVDLNVKDLANRIGESEETIQGAIDFLCAPDPLTTTPGEDGRRLVKVGTFAYRVVNGVHYAEIRNEEDRREKNRVRQAEHRKRKKLAKWRAPMAKKAGERETMERVASCLGDGGGAVS